MSNAKSSTMFTDLDNKRSSHKEIWDLCAKYTLPQIYLEDSVRESGVEPEDLVIGDSIGAESLNNFISQLSKIVFPIQGAFFRVDKKRGDTPNIDSLSETQQRDVYRKLEENAMEALYIRGLHAQKFMLLAQLIGLGDVVFKIPRERQSEMQVYDMNDAVIKRTRNGRLADLIIKENTEHRFLSDKAKRTLQLKGKKVYKEEDILALYTHVRLNSNNKFEVHMSVEDISLDTGLNFYACDKCEYNVASITLKRGSNHGTGIVQQYLPLIHKANVYADTNTDIAVAGSLVNWAIKPNAAIRPEEFAEREQGQPFAVNPDDIKAIVADVGNHLQITSLQYQAIVNTLQRVFLLPQAVQRDAERVTAQEIRMVAAKIEEQHSGLYAQIAERLQRPMAVIGLDMVDDEDLIMYKDEVEVKVVTAMEAQSRGMELDNMLASLGDATIFNSVPPQVAERIKIENVMSTIFNNRNVDAPAYIKSTEEFNAEQQEMANREAEAQAAQQAPQLSQTQVFQPNQGLLEDIRQPMI